MQQLTMEFLVPPRNQKTHVLGEMIKGRMISERDFVYNRFRGIISDLRLEYEVPIRHQDVPFENTFGRKSSYRKHYIMEIDREEAIAIYNKINQ